MRADDAAVVAHALGLDREPEPPHAGPTAPVAGPDHNGSGPAPGRRTILVRNELVAVATEAEAALLAAPDPGIYVRGRMLVRVARDEGLPRTGLTRPPGTPVIEPLSLDALRKRIDEVAEWVRWDPRKKKEVPALPPEWVPRTIAAADGWRFPPLLGVIEAPTITAAGEILDRPGYDPASGLLFIPSVPFPPMPRDPSAAELVAAYRLLCEPFHDFPFVAPCDKAAAIANTFTLVARHAVPGPVPAFAWRSPTPGTGKGLGADVSAVIGTGRPAPRTALPPKDDELRKAILAVAIEGTPCVLLDNVDSSVGSSALAAALTATSWRDRLLGVSRTVEAPLHAVWMTSGNGTVFRGDLGRRVVPVDLDAHSEFPEDRDGWRHPDLVTWVQEHRAELLVAVLTLLRGYHVAGRPAHGRGPRKGSYEAWDDLVRGCCIWAEFGDPLGGVERIRREDDGDLVALRGVLAAWAEAFEDDPTTAAEATAAALRRADPKKSDDPGLRDALMGILSRYEKKLEGRALGYALRRVKGRIAAGLYFEAAGEVRGGTTWVVRRCGDGGDE